MLLRQNFCLFTLRSNIDCRSVESILKRSEKRLSAFPFGLPKQISINLYLVYQLPLFSALVVWTSAKKDAAETKIVMVLKVRHS